MSGGHFESALLETSEEIESLIEQNGKKREKPASWESEYRRTFSPEVIARFEEAMELISKTQLYIHHIDWLVSGDDGEESFLKRLAEDLQRLNKQSQTNKKGAGFKVSV